MSASSSTLAHVIGPAPGVILEGLAHRGDLIALELGDARDHAARTAVAAILAVAGAVLTGFATLFALAALVWHRDDRGLIMSVAALAFLIGTVASGWWAARRLKSWQPLAETRRQLAADRACLESLLPKSAP